MLHLITSFYLCKKKDRQSELNKTLHENINNKFISKIYLFIDNTESFKLLNKNYKEFLDSKIVIINIGKQPLYTDLFKYANTLKNKICIIANSDIWLKTITNKELLKRIKR